MGREGQADTADIVIVGAGAAGLATAIFTAEAAQVDPRARIVLLDGASRIGAKILVSGGGRCNVTHREVVAGDFSGHQVLVRNVLAALPVERTVAWFQSLGVELVEEDTGKLFPVSNAARTVLDALVERCRELGVTVRTNHRVTSITAPSALDDRFEVACGGTTSGNTASDGTVSGATVIRARRVVLATGGRSLPRSGSDGAGWAIAKTLGHSITTTVPALVPLVLDGGFFHGDLSGISGEVTLTTRVDGEVVDRRTGSMLWTHFGVSGPVAMDASRFYTLAKGAGQAVSVSCNLLPGHDRATADRLLLRRCGASPKASVKRMLSGASPVPLAERLAEALCRHAGIDARTAAGQLSKAGRRALVEALTNLVLPVVADRGWNHAEVTAGGVPLDEVSYQTMQSRRMPGLYLVGEALDCDGRIGGFNFQWAWSTAFVVGNAIASSLASSLE